MPNFSTVANVWGKQVPLVAAELALCFRGVSVGHGMWLINFQVLEIALDL